MNKLWIYGCSFSEPFGLEKDGEPHLLDFATGLRDFKGVSYWGSYLAEKLEYECISKSCAGRGWNYMNYRIDQDILEWSINDIIIISPSVFSRIDIVEFEPNKNPIISRNSDFNCQDMMRPLNELIEENQERWKTKIATLQKFGFNVYTWLMDSCENTDTVKNLISPETLDTWYDWIQQHPEYWLVPGKDWHFNDQGHLKIANFMYNTITKHTDE